MDTSKPIYWQYVMVLIIAMLCITFTDSYAINEDNSWQRNENLVRRLRAEWYKISLLERDLNAIDDIISNTREFELYPIELIKFNSKELNDYNKKIKRMEKKYEHLKQRTAQLRPEMIDAMGILREMVVGAVVEDMFEVIEKGDLQRITEMLEIKHEIAVVWEDIDNLLNELMKSIGLQPNKNEEMGIIEKEFFEIVRSNLGQHSEMYYDKVREIKEYLIEKVTESQLTEIYKIEKSQIKTYVANDKIYLAHKRVEDALSLFRGKMNTDELHKIMIRIQIDLGLFHEALELLRKISENRILNRSEQLYLFQSLYALQEYDTIWQYAQKVSYNEYSGAKKNLVIWMILESGLALKAKGAYVEIAANIDKNYSYAPHALHALARYYLQKGDPVTARSIYASALTCKGKSENDRVALKKIRLGVANLDFELGQYESALQSYYDLLNDDNADFDRVVYGIVWCYIKSGRNKEAEITMKKLINQNPSSPLAAETIFLLAKYLVKKADSEWNKFVYREDKKQRLEEMAYQLKMKDWRDSTKQEMKKYSQVQEKLNALLDIIESEYDVDYSSILSLYKKAKNVCELVQSHYATGTFQEISFSAKREELLHILDSLIITIKGEKRIRQNGKSVIMDAMKNREKIKSIVHQIAIFEAELLLRQFQWERSYLDHEKTKIGKKEMMLDDAIGNTTGNSDRAKLLSEQKGIQERMDALLESEQDLKHTFRKKITGKIKALLHTDLQPEDWAYLRYHLGEQYYEQENEQFAQAYEKYENRMVRNGGAPNDKSVNWPGVDHDKSIECFRSIINDKKNDNYKAAAHYSLAWCMNDKMLLDSAFKHMEIVATRYPESGFAPQAWLYCGEYNFDKAKLDDAIKNYKSVLKYPNSEWFDEALYKLAWTQYRLSHPEKAISSFIALIDLSTTNMKNRSVLEKEALDYVAISFSEIDILGEKGLDRAVSFAKKFGDKEKTIRILQRLAAVYIEQGRNDMAQKTYMTLLRLYPQTKQKDIIEAKIINALEQELSQEEIAYRKMKYHELFGKNSRWYRQHPDSGIRSRADSIATEFLYESAITLHQLALEKRNTNFYEKAASLYKLFVQNYEHSKHANECHYNYAEIEFSLGNYKEAALEYMNVSQKYPESKFREPAAWNAIVALQNLLKKEDVVQ